MAVTLGGYAYRAETLPAGADLSAKRFYFVKRDANTYILCTGATDVPAGVLQNKPELGEDCEVIALGPTKVVADAALSIGYLIGTSADGQADRKIPGTDTTEYVVGMALEAATAAGDVIGAFVNCFTPHRAS